MRRLSWILILFTIILPCMAGAVLLVIAWMRNDAQSATLLLAAILFLLALALALIIQMFRTPTPPATTPPDPPARSPAGIPKGPHNPKPLVAHAKPDRDE